MHKNTVTNCYLLIFFLLPVVLSGCTSARVDLHTPEHSAVIHEDLQEIFPKEPLTADKNGIIQLDVETALKRGVQQNLDARVSFMELMVEQSDISIESLRALPSLQVQGKYNGRSNIASSSSKSILTQSQSLEPSQSTDQHQREAEISVTWNLIDTALAISETKNAREEEEISKGRYCKIVQSIQRDVYSAYWRALAYQKTAPQTKTLIVQLQEKQGALQRAAAEGLISPSDANEKSAALGEKIRQLNDKQETLALADIELKSLLTLPPEAKLKLKDEDRKFKKEYKTLLQAKIEDLEWEALQARPEVNKEILKKNISAQNIHQEILKTFPGFEVFAGKNYASNSFLTHKKWNSFSALIMQSLNNLISAPARYRKAKNEEALGEARRQALLLAIIAQTHIARTRLEFAQRRQGEIEDSYRFAKKKTFNLEKQKQSGFASGEGVLEAQAEQHEKDLEQYIATIAVHDSYAALLNTLGRDIVPMQSATKKEAS